MTPDAGPPWLRQKPAGRAPKRSEAKTAMLSTRVNPLERDAWNELARQLEKGPSEMLAEAVREVLRAAWALRLQATNSHDDAGAQA